jgi:GT2 family glycosyltransferase
MKNTIRRLTAFECAQLFKKANLSATELEEMKDILLGQSIFNATLFYEKINIDRSALKFLAMLQVCSLAVISSANPSARKLGKALGDYSSLLYGLTIQDSLLTSAARRDIPNVESLPFRLSRNTWQWFDDGRFVKDLKTVLYAHRALFYDEKFYQSSNPDVTSDIKNHYMNYGFGEYLEGLRRTVWSCLSPPTSLLKTLGGCTPWDEYLYSLKSIFTQADRIPKISVVIPTYNPDYNMLVMAIESVLMQPYPCVEIIVVDDCSTNGVLSRVRDIYGETAEIIFSKMNSNSHITAATNHGIDISSGEYICFLDHDDELSIDAFAFVGCYLLDDKNIDYLYSDEAKIDPNGNPYGVFNKPAWSPLYLTSCGYTTHLSVYKKSFLVSNGKLSAGYDGAQDYALTLKTLVSNGIVAHIPWNLYYWREHNNSTALANSNAKPYAYKNAVKALSYYLKELYLVDQIAVYSHPFFPGHTQIMPMMDEQCSVDIIIPTANRRITLTSGESFNLLDNLLASIESNSSANPLIKINIHVIHNGDLDLEQIARYSTSERISLIEYKSSSFNLANKMNIGARASRSEYIVFMNDDMQVITPDWLTILIAYIRLPGVGAAGPKLLFDNGRIQHVGIDCFGLPGHTCLGLNSNHFGHASRNLAPREVSGVTGACLAVKRDTFNDIGQFREDYPLNYNDVVLCNDLAAQGLSSVFIPYVQLFHFESASKEGPGTVSAGETSRYITDIKPSRRVECFSR